MEQTWKAELIFLTYYRTLSHLSGVQYSDRYWNALCDWEHQAWCEAAKELEEANRLMGDAPKR